MFIPKKPKRKHKCWVKSWLKKRNEYSHMNLLLELKENNPYDFKNYLRMTEDEYKYLIDILSPLIQKKNTVLRESIPVDDRLAVTLRYLATGRSFEDLKFSAIISAQSLGRIIPETCRAIYQALRETYLKFPTSPGEWLEVASAFEKMWNFPNCGGAIDGKHVAIVCPPNSGSMYYNYKGYYSIVLLGLVDANYKFLMADVGVNGRISDGGVIEMTEFFARLKNNELNLPSTTQTTGQLNFTFLGDSAFSLRPDVLKPFPQKGITYDELIFNYRLSRARRVVENAFGIMASRFRVFHTTINMKPNKVQDVVLACIVLHNFLRRNGSYITRSSVDSEDTTNGCIIDGEWRGETIPQNAYVNLQCLSARRLTEVAKKSRQDYLEYFCGIGSVEWQDKMVA